MDKPLVTIVCTAFERSDALEKTILQLRQNLGLPYELLIYDNSSQPLKLSIRLLDHEQMMFTGTNLGTLARREGIRAARGQYTLLLDDDSAPLPGVAGRAVAQLKGCPAHVAGLMANVLHPDGGREATLLPTVSLGCGVLFRTKMIQAVDGGYPENFVFYGEEYWQALSLYQKGWVLQYAPEFKVLHHADKSKQNKERIFYYLSRNNALIWQHFTPPEYLTQILADTQRRYELLSKKEDVHNAFLRGRDDALTLAGTNTAKHLSPEQFKRFSLLDLMEEVPCKGKTVIMCGTGKFPSLWANHLLQQGAEDVLIYDFNMGLIEQTFGNFRVQDPANIAPAAGELIYILGHSSFLDTDRWSQLLETYRIKHDQCYYLPQ